MVKKRRLKVLAGAGFVGAATFGLLLRLEHNSPIERPAPTGPFAVSRKIMGEIESVYAGLPPTGRALVTLRGANHFSFSDDALLKSGCVMKLLSPLDARRGLAITADYVRRFFDTQLKGDLKALPPGAPLYPEIEVGGPGF